MGQRNHSRKPVTLNAESHPNSHKTFAGRALVRRRNGLPSIAFPAATPEGPR